jgi:hypothetical protein
VRLMLHIDADQHVIVFISINKPKNRFVQLIRRIASLCQSADR